MPKVVSYTPEWLSKPNPGHAIFSNTTFAHTLPESLNGTNPTSKRAAKPGPRRTIVHRGTQVFVAVGKEIRWADLVYLKEAWQHSKKSKRYTGRQSEEESQFEEPHAQGYRVCLATANELF
jgi:nucleoporin NUP82